MTTEPSESARTEALGTYLYRAAFTVGEVLNRLEADPAAGAILAETEANAFDELYIKGEAFMQALKCCGMRLNRRTMGDARDEMEREAKNGK